MTRKKNNHKLAFLKNYKRQAAIVVAVLAFFYLYFSFFSQAFLKNISLGNFVLSVDHSIQPCKYFSQLNGVCLGDNKESLTPVAVMIDNSVDARPLYGLENASIVYEAIVESGITRHVAIFESTLLEDDTIIGPVRSARPYYLDWAQEWDSVIFHSGGSPDALAILKTGKLKNVNEISADGIYFYRNWGLIRPHNLFTTGELINKAVEAKDYIDESKFKQWLFKDEPIEIVPDQNESTITIDFSGPEYKVRYDYNTDNNSYDRFLGGNDTGITVKNVVIQYTKSRVVDSEARLKVTTAGRGDAEIYQDGKKIDGYWQTSKRRTRFFENSGEEIEFNRGFIWVEVVFDKSTVQSSESI